MKKKIRLNEQTFNKIVKRMVMETIQKLMNEEYVEPADWALRSGPGVSNRSNYYEALVNSMQAIRMMMYSAQENPLIKKYFLENVENYIQGMYQKWNEYKSIQRNAKQGEQDTIGPRYCAWYVFYINKIQNVYQNMRQRLDSAGYGGNLKANWDKILSKINEAYSYVNQLAGR